jgi:hypothetical protein
MTIEEEIKQGNKAHQAYDVYMKNYFDKFKSKVAERMYNDEDLFDLRNEIKAIKALEEIILLDIETGLLAQLQKGN